MPESNPSAGELEESGEGCFEFVVTSGDSAELFEFGEEPFDAVSRAVSFGVGGQIGVIPVRPGGELGHDAASETGTAEVVAVEALVADEFMNDGHAFPCGGESGWEQWGVVRLPRS